MGLLDSKRIRLQQTLTRSHNKVNEKGDLFMVWSDIFFRLFVYFLPFPLLISITSFPLFIFFSPKIAHLLATPPDFHFHFARCWCSISQSFALSNNYSYCHWKVNNAHQWHVCECVIWESFAGVIRSIVLTIYVRALETNLLNNKVPLTIEVARLSIFI